jgi:hypothetical protein
MAVLETLEDLRELNAANAGIDPKIILNAEEEYKRNLEILQKEEDEEEIKQMFSKKSEIIEAIKEKKIKQTFDEVIHQYKIMNFEKKNLTIILKIG